MIGDRYEEMGGAQKQMNGGRIRKSRGGCGKGDGVGEARGWR